MNVFDWLGQVQRLFKYARSWGTLFVSLGIVCILTGITVDFLYSTLYKRIYNTPNTHYGLLYWLLLLGLCAALPLSYAVYRVGSWLLLQRQFPPDTLGIAITQFEVWPGSSGQASGSERSNATSEVIPSFFEAVRSRLSDDPDWSASFSLKFLPPTLRIRNGREAENLLRRQRAILVVWGWLAPTSDGKMQVELHFTGPDLTLKSTGTMDSFGFLEVGSESVKFYSLMAAALAAGQRSDHCEAIRFTDMALLVAVALDKRAKDTTEGSVRVAMANVRRSARLAVAHPDRYSPDLGASLTTLAGTLSRLGHPADALTAGQRAVIVFRTLSADSPGRYRLGLAAALASLGGQFSGQGRLSDALPVSQEAADLYRELAATDPGQHRAGLANALAELGGTLDAMGRPADALPASQEAADLYRELAATDPGQYRSPLAALLVRLGTQLSAVDRVADALPVFDEAVGLYLELDDAGQEHRREPDLAAALTCLGDVRSRLGHPAGALTAYQDAVAIRRDLAADDPGRYLAALAGSLISVANALDPLGRSLDALQATEEAVGSYRGLAESSPGRYRPDLASSLVLHGVRLTNLGRPADALRPGQEAVDLYHELADTNAGRYRPGLGLSLLDLAIALGQLERPADTLPVIEEAVGVFRELAAEGSPVYGPYLAASLSGLGDALDLLGRPAEAEAARGEAARLGERPSDADRALA